MKPVFQHVTVPVDGSTASARGIAFALELARGGGRVSFCSVVDPTLAYMPVAAGAGADPGPLLDILDNDAAAFCREAEAAAARQAVDADARVLHGPCISEIDGFAAHNASDAIVIGTHGRRGVARALLGSVAEGVLRRSEIPVVAVHEKDEMRTGPVGVAFDASPAAQAALDVAIGIAGAREMPMLLLHVCGPAANRVDVNALLERATARVRSYGVMVRPVLHEGVPADALLRAADAHDCCMIVMGTHGRSVLAQVVLGSVAAAVVQRAQIPVVTVRRAA